MKTFAIVAVAVLLCLAGLGAAPDASAQAGKAPATDTLDGKVLFTAQSCNTCHAVSSVGIAAKMKASKAPDLAKPGEARDTQWRSKYLRQQTDANGKKHPKPFTGSDEQLGALLSWLDQQQKTK